MRYLSISFAQVLLNGGLYLFALGEEDDHPPEALNHPGGPRCYYDALAEGCPSSISTDGYQWLCSCEYRDNTWFHVLGNFLTIFRAGEAERSKMSEMFNARPEAGGVLSLDVGLPERLQCSAELAAVYPGTNNLVDTSELYRFLGNLFWGQVRQKLIDVCVPGRIALQLICQHALLHGLKDMRGAKAYADKAAELWTMVEKCVERDSPWPFPGLSEHLQHWKGTELPDASQMAWYPEPRRMRAKRPEESDAHYWSCVPIQDPQCFPVGSDNDYTSCSHCCDPGQGPTGDANCFVGEWTFARCCRTPNDSGRFY